MDWQWAAAAGLLFTTGVGSWLGYLTLARLESRAELNAKQR